MTKPDPCDQMEAEARALLQAVAAMRIGGIGPMAWTNEGITEATVRGVVPGHRVTVTIQMTPAYIKEI